MKAFEEGQFVVDMEDCVSAVDHIEATLGEDPLSGVSHLKLDLKGHTLLPPLSHYLCSKTNSMNELVDIQMAASQRLLAPWRCPPCFPTGPGQVLRLQRSETLRNRYHHHNNAFPLQQFPFSATSFTSYFCHVEVSSTNAAANIENLLSWLQVQQVHKLLSVHTKSVIY